MDMMAPSQQTSGGRVRQLDVLRFVAIFLVLGVHPVVRWEGPEQMLMAAKIWYWVGWTGVDLFFVLSGFLIGGLLFAEYRATGKIRVKRFLIRRALKIWPCYYMYLAILLLVVSNLGGTPFDLIPFALHLQNYMSDQSFAAHTWSLAVEEHFYLALPLVLFWAMPYCGYRSMVTFTLVLAVVCGVLRGISEFEVPIIYTHLRIDSLIFGVLLGYIYHFHREQFDAIAQRRILLLSIGIPLILLVTVTNPAGSLPPPGWEASLAHLFVGVGYGCCMLAFLSVPLDRGVFSTRPVRWAISTMAWIGLYSYPIYLWHIDFGYRISEKAISYLDPNRQNPILLWLAGSALYVALSFGFGVLVGRCVETPVLILRDRLFPRTAKPLG